MPKLAFMFKMQLQQKKSHIETVAKHLKHCESLNNVFSFLYKAKNSISQ